LRALEKMELNGMFESKKYKVTGGLRMLSTVKLSVDKKNQLDVTFVFFISLLIVAQHVSGNHVPIIRS
jgi:hypothetical protein